MAKTKHKHQVLIAINVCNCILLKADSMHNNVRRARVSFYLLNINWSWLVTVGGGDAAVHRGKQRRGGKSARAHVCVHYLALTIRNK